MLLRLYGSLEDLGFWFLKPQPLKLEYLKYIPVVLEKTLESPLACKEIQPVHSEGDQPWDFFGRNDAKTETPVLWPPHAKSWLIGKESDAERDWGQEEKGMTEDEMAGWHHRLDGREFEWTSGVGDEQGGLACCDSWGCKESDTTERLNWTELDCKDRMGGDGNGSLEPCPGPLFQSKGRVWAIVFDAKLMVCLPTWRLIVRQKKMPPWGWGFSIAAFCRVSRILWVQKRSFDSRVGSPSHSPGPGRLMQRCQPSRLKQSEALLDRNKLKCAGEEGRGPRWAFQWLAQPSENQTLAEGGC